MKRFSRLSLRLLAFNLLLVFLPAAGFLYLDVYETQLLDAQERAMVQQGRLLAAALGGAGELDAARSEALLRRLEQRTEARLRVVGTDGAVLADTSRMGPQAESQEVSGRSASYSSYPVRPETRESLLYRGGVFLYRLYRLGRRALPEPVDSKLTRSRAPAPTSSSLGPEVREALAGRYGAAIRRSPWDPRSRILNTAIPIRSDGRVVGAVVVSQSTFRILGELVEVRLGIFRVFLASVAAAVVLSLLVATTIARPLKRLRDEASALLDRRGRLRGSFRGSRRKDEIGDLTRALEELTRQLEGHLRFIETFAADVSHEFKNPLAAIRGATEMVAEVDDPAARARLLGVVEREVARMERLLSGVREITEIDARLEDEAAAPLDLAALLNELVESYRLRSGRDVGIDLRTPGPGGRAVVRASPERLTQIFENILDNAVGFSPPGGTVTLEMEPGPMNRVRVADQGPGIPDAHLDRIFDRFFSYRPSEPHARNGHTGLGLAIARAIAEGYGGTITAANRPEGGAAIEVSLPGA